MSRIEELKALEKAAKQGGTCDCGNRTGIPKDCKDECNRVRLSASNAYHNAAVAAHPALLEIAAAVHELDKDATVDGQFGEELMVIVNEPKWARLKAALEKLETPQR